jgi:hypothetical protein
MFINSDEMQLCLDIPMHWVHKNSKVGYGSNYGTFERWENVINLHVHEDKITKLILWVFEFGGVYICTIVLYC